MTKRRLSVIVIQCSKIKEHVFFEGDEIKVITEADDKFVEFCKKYVTDWYKYNSEHIRDFLSDGKYQSKKDLVEVYVSEPDVVRVD